MAEKTKDSSPRRAVTRESARTTTVRRKRLAASSRTSLKRPRATIAEAGRETPRANLAQAVYESIKADIFEFRLIPGARFSENEVARRTGVSRTPVREALYR